MDKSIMRSIFLIAIIAAIVFIQKNVDIQQFSEDFLGEDGETIFTSDLNYTEEEQDSIKLTYNGYWVFDGEESDGVHLYNKLFLRENGIMWQYEIRTVDLPYGVKDTLVRVSTSYLLPYARIDSVRHFCYERLIRQNWDINGETCSGKSVELLENMYNNTVERSNIIWATEVQVIDESTLRIKGLDYKRFEGDPAGGVGFWGEEAFAATETINDMAVEGCGSADPHLTWMRDQIIEAIKLQELSPEVVVIEQKMMVKNYFAPLCLNRLQIEYGETAGEDIIMQLTISEAGTVEEVRFSGTPVNGETFKQGMLEDEITKWIFTGTPGGSEITVAVPAVSGMKAILQAR